MAMGVSVERSQPFKLPYLVSDPRFESMGTNRGSLFQLQSRDLPDFSLGLVVPIGSELFNRDCFLGCDIVDVNPIISFHCVYSQDFVEEGRDKPRGAGFPASVHSGTQLPESR